MKNANVSQHKIVQELKTSTAQPSDILVVDDNIFNLQAMETMLKLKF
jgi:PleD family two-component response regulator